MTGPARSSTAQTGALSTYPGVPPTVIAELYRTHQPTVVAQRRTVDPEVELRRNARRRPTPTTAAHLTVDGRLFIARGAKGDQEINHHPLVAAYLADLEPARTVRGTERHAELIVLSDALHEADRQRDEPLDVGRGPGLAAHRRLRGLLRPRPG